MKQKWMLLSLLTLLVVGCGSNPDTEGNTKPTDSPSTENRTTTATDTLPTMSSYRITFMDEDGNQLESNRNFS